MNRIISKNLRWDGSVIVEPRTFDLLKFFVPREGMRVSKVFAELLRWVVYTHDTSCGRLFANCLDLRRTIQEDRLCKDLPITETFRLADGLCLVASLIGEQFNGKKGWLLMDGSTNVFLLNISGQALAVSVSCLDDSGEFFVDEWWLLIDKTGPLRARDRIFTANQSESLARAIPAHRLAWAFPVHAPENGHFATVHVERRSANRGVYRSGLGGHSLHVYLRRHTVKRFRDGPGSRLASKAATLCRQQFLSA